MIDPARPIDAHVHIVGNGSGGTGCRLQPRGWRRLTARAMIERIGLPPDALTADLDALYVARLLELVRGSTLRAVVILAQEKVYDSAGRVVQDATAYYVPNDYVLELAHRHPEFLPAVSIHPAREDALDELERCLAGGAVMMKCLPMCQNIDCNEPRFRPFWERMAEAGLPLLAHTGSEHTLPVVRPELADPAVLRLPLECGVTCIAAHCGTRSSPLSRDWFRTFAEMVRRYPNLYGDTSAFHLPLRSRHVRSCLREPLASRMIHGSDYPVPVFGHWLWMRGQLGWQIFQSCQKVLNVLERDYRLKQALGFAPEVFTRIAHLLRLPNESAPGPDQPLTEPRP
ncbi:MAG: amidohydrolase [bacterium]|nr:amidohydrolase [bacterium]